MTGVNMRKRFLKIICEPGWEDLADASSRDFAGDDASSRDPWRVITCQSNGSISKGSQRPLIKILTSPDTDTICNATIGRVSQS
jgi:hypothetical protein